MPNKMRRLERIELAKNRIRKNLGVRLLCNMRQLESKISESGPPSKLCDPHIIWTACKELQNAGLINAIEGPKNSHFAVRDDFVPSCYDVHAKRRDYIFDLYKKYRKLAENDNHCGFILENIILDAVAQTEKYTFIGPKNHPTFKFGSIELPGELDLTVTAKRDKSFMILGEAKNIREWIYPSSIELWQFINKCVVFAETKQTFAPVFISRRIHFSTRYLFKKIGILGAQTYNQIYSSSITDELKDIKHKDGLGFHNITTDNTTPEWMIRWFDTTVWNNAEDASKRFYEHLPIIKEHSKKLATDSLRNNLRKDEWKKLSLKLGFRREYDDIEYYSDD